MAIQPRGQAASHRGGVVGFQVELRRHQPLHPGDKCTVSPYKHSICTVRLCRYLIHLCESKENGIDVTAHCHGMLCARGTLVDETHLGRTFAVVLALTPHLSLRSTLSADASKWALYRVPDCEPGQDLPDWLADDVYTRQVVKSIAIPEFRTAFDAGGKEFVEFLTVTITTDGTTTPCTGTQAFLVPLSNIDNPGHDDSYMGSHWKRLEQDLMPCGSASARLRLSRLHSKTGTPSILAVYP